MALQWGGGWEEEERESTVDTYVPSLITLQFQAVLLVILLPHL